MKENEMHFINTHTCISVDQPGVLVAHVSVLLDKKKKKKDFILYLATHGLLSTSFTYLK
jgi:hypothetical protein